MWRRWIIRGFFILPVLLCVAGWLWSATHYAAIGYVHDGREVWCGSGEGALEVALSRCPSKPNGWDSVVYLEPACYWPKADPQSWLGFEFGHGSEAGVDTHWVMVPYWFLLLAAGGVLAVVWRLTRAKPRAGRGFEVQLADKENGPG